MNSHESIAILLIEDDEEFRTLLEVMLEDEGYEVLGASSGEMALEIADKSTFDLVVTDVKLGGIDGLDTLAELKQGRSELQSMVITGYATEADSIRAISLGVGNYLKKPFKLPDFLRAVEEVVHHILKERQQSHYQEAVLRTALWGLERVCETIHKDGTVGLVAAGRAAETVAVSRGLSAKEGRQTRLAVLAFGVARCEAGKEVPFLTDILPEESTWLIQRLRESEDEGQSDETEIARFALALSTSSNPDELQGVWAEAFRRALQGKESSVDGESAERSDGSLMALARAFEVSGDFESATAVLDRLQDQEGVYSSKAFLSRAQLAHVQGDHGMTLELLNKAEEAARSLRLKSEVMLEGGLLLYFLGREERARKWLDQAQEGFDHLQDTLECSRATLARAYVRREETDTLHQDLSLLLSPSGLEKLLGSGHWLFSYLLDQEPERVSQRALYRIARDVPHLVCQIFPRLRNTESQLKALEVIDEVGTEGYDDLLQDLMLGSEPKLAQQARRLLTSTDSVRMAPILRLYSLGVQSTWVGEKKVPDKGWTGRLPCMVLTYLAQNQGSFVTQDHLIDLFWDGSLRGNKSLNQVLVTVRSKLRSPDWPEKLDYVSRKANLVGINPEQTVWHDASVLKETLAEARTLLYNQQHREAADLIERAIDLDRGPYLETCFDDWALTFRTSLDSELIHLLCQLADIRLAQKNPEQALITSQRVLEKEPFSNQALQSLLQSYIDLGRPEEAIRTFEKIQPAMKQELDLEPSIELVKLYHRAKLGV